MIVWATARDTDDQEGREQGLMQGDLDLGVKGSSSLAWSWAPSSTTREPASATSRGLRARSLVPRPQRAARGGDARRYPWGNAAPSAERLNWDGEEDDGFPQTAPVGSFDLGRSPSPYGAQDLGGNVAEWVAGPDGPWSMRDTVVTSPSHATWYPVRGGSWASFRADLVRATYRHPVPIDRRVDIVGFRCACDAR